MRTLPVIGAIVDGHALLEVVWVSLLAGVGVTGVFGLAILGTTRAMDMGRDGRPVEAAVFGAVGALALLGVIAAVAFGIVIMTQKD